ncbi:MAG: patatin-like phospholipase family protein [Euzebyales bacterium]|nr:patatin-like phospholipase family protein [Euzebyales bacterium]
MYETAFVLGGGGVLGANEVGVLRALFEAGVRPDLVVGTSIGALNGAVVASDPTPASVDRLARIWESLSREAVFGGSTVRRLRSLVESRVALHSMAPMRAQLLAELGAARIEDLAVPFQCCAASIERASEHWFADGPLVEAVLASCAVPGMFPPVEVDGEHFIDGGIVNSIPVGRAVELGARTVYVLQVGRVERPLAPPTSPFEVATVAFEVARRHRFAREIAAAPAGVVVHVLPTGEPDAPAVTMRYRDLSGTAARIEQAYLASAAYLRGAGIGG